MGAGATPPGWYPDVERPGGERYWDGSQWTEDRRPALGSPPPGGATGAVFDQPPTTTGPPSAAPGYQQPYQAAPQGYQPYGAYGTAYPTKSNAGVALALSILGFVCCGLLAIPGAIMGRNEVKAVDAGTADPSNRGLANAAFIVGIIALAINAIVIIGYVIVVVIAVGSS